MPLSFKMQWLLSAHFRWKKPESSCFQTLAKAFRLQEAEETLLVFDNYSDNP